jgi:hypothetical protein
MVVGWKALGDAAAFLTRKMEERMWSVDCSLAVADALQKAPHSLPAMVISRTAVAWVEADILRLEPIGEELPEHPDLLNIFEKRITDCFPEFHIARFENANEVRQAISKEHPDYPAWTQWNPWKEDLMNFVRENIPDARTGHVFETSIDGPPAPGTDHLLGTWQACRHGPTLAILLPNGDLHLAAFEDIESPGE